MIKMACSENVCRCGWPDYSKAVMEILYHPGVSPERITAWAPSSVESCPHGYRTEKGHTLRAHLPQDRQQNVQSVRRPKTEIPPSKIHYIDGSKVWGQGPFKAPSKCSYPRNVYMPLKQSVRRHSKVQGKVHFLEGRELLDNLGKYVNAKMIINRLWSRIHQLHSSDQ